MRGAVPCSGQLSNEEATGVEAEAFWAFAAVMDAGVGANFSSDSRWVGLLGLLLLLLLSRRRRSRRRSGLLHCSTPA